MSKLPVKDMKGQSVGEYELPDDLLVFDKGQQAVYEAIVAYQANQRAGSATTLSKGQVAGTGGKPWKQKGTGRARAGYQQSPVWRGGSVAFGPRLRSFARQLPRKTARLAFRRALSEKVSAGQVVVLDDLAIEMPKTKQMADVLKALEAHKGAVLVLDKANEAVRLSVRNMPHVQVTTAQHVNVYDVLRYPLVLVTRPGMDVLTERLKEAGGNKG